MQQKVLVGSDGELFIRPQLSSRDVKDMALLCFGLKIDPNVEVKELNSYDDRNYIVQGKLDSRGQSFDEKYRHHSKFILKIFNSYITYKYDWYENINTNIGTCYEECLQHFKLPFLIPGLNARTMVVYDVPLVEDAEVECSTLSLGVLASTSEMLHYKDGICYVKHLVRLYVFIPGEIQDVRTMNGEQAFEYGKAAALLDSALAKVSPPQIDIQDTQEKFIWNLINVMNIGFVDKYVKSLKDDSRRHSVECILESFQNETLPKLKRTTKQWVHGDLNDQNILFSKNNLVGILDFDDNLYSYRAVDLGTCLMYVTNVISGPSDVEKALLLAKQLFRGYTSITKINDDELECLYNVMLVRYVQSCCIGTYQYEFFDPGNEYLLITSKIGWNSMENLVLLGEERFIQKLKEN